MVNVLPHNLFWKELRELWVIAPTFAAFQGFVVMILFFHLGNTPAPAETVRISLWGNVVAAAAMLGAHFASAERNGFLRQLPLRSRDVLLAKLAAAVACVSLLTVWMLSLPLFFSNVLPAASAFFSALPPFVLVAALAWSLAAWFSSLGYEPASAFLGSILLVIAGALFHEVVGLPWALPFTAGLTTVLLIAVTRRLGEPDKVRREGLLISTLLGALRRRPRLATVEIRRNGPVLMILGGLILVAGMIETPVLWSLGPLTGVVLGCLFYSREERDGNLFFLHHLPMDRRSLVAKRFAAGLLFGLFLVAYCGLLMGLNGDWSIHVLLRIKVLYVLAFAFGAMLAPWFRSPPLAMIMAAMTWAAWAAQSVTPSPSTILWIAVFVLTAMALAWWSVVQRRSLEPFRGRTVLALALLAPFWMAWWIVV